MEGARVGGRVGTRAKPDNQLVDIYIMLPLNSTHLPRPY